MVSKRKPHLGGLRGVGGRALAMRVACSLSYQTKARGWLPKGSMGLKELVLFLRDFHMFKCHLGGPVVLNTRKGSPPSVTDLEERLCQYGRAPPRCRLELEGG